jgi:hypothetical protein
MRLSDATAALLLPAASVAALAPTATVTVSRSLADAAGVKSSVNAVAPVRGREGERGVCEREQRAPATADR